MDLHICEQHVLYVCVLCLDFGETFYIFSSDFFHQNVEPLLALLLEPNGAG
jgi:hypothetical protein